MVYLLLICDQFYFNMFHRPCGDQITRCTKRHSAQAKLF
jgi:hypothetical protein